MATVDPEKKLQSRVLHWLKDDLGYTYIGDLRDIDNTPIKEDLLSANLKNIATLLSRKHVYFVPMNQDDPEKKPHSLVADFTRIPETLHAAMEGRQFRRLFL